MEDRRTTLIDQRLLLDQLHLKPGMRVGDFGVGGAAAFVTNLSRLVGANGEVYMFDIQKSALSGALSTAKMRGCQNCKAVWANLELYEGARGIGHDTLDAGLLVNVLHQTTKPKDMLAEIHRMLRAGARLLIVDWMTDAKSSIAPDQQQRHAAEQVEELTRSLGFATERLFRAGPFHWGLVAVKT